MLSTGSKPTGRGSKRIPLAMVCSACSNPPSSSFGAGAVAGGVGYGAGAGLMKVADKFWGELSRSAQKQAITGLGKVSQAQVNIVLKQIKNGVTDNIYRQLVKDYGMDVVLAATVSAVGTEVKGK